LVRRLFKKIKKKVSISSNIKMQKEVITYLINLLEKLKRTNDHIKLHDTNISNVMLD